MMSTFLAQTIGARADQALRPGAWHRGLKHMHGRKAMAQLGQRGPDGSPASIFANLDWLEYKPVYRCSSIGILAWYLGLLSEDLV